MRRKMLLLVPILTVALGCAAFPAKRTPRLEKPRIAAELRDVPTIRLVVHDRTDRPEKTERALERARSRFSYLSSASADSDDPSYTIELSVGNTVSVGKLSELAAYSFFVIPAVGTEEVSVTGRISAVDGRLLGVVESTGRSKRVVQLHLLWVLPLAAPLATHVDRKMWTNTFRDVFIQASEVIAEDQRATVGTGSINAARIPASSSEVHGGTGPAVRPRG